MCSLDAGLSQSQCLCTSYGTPVRATSDSGRAIFIGVNEIFAAFSLREEGKRAEQMIE